MKAAKSQGEQLVNDWKYLCPQRLRTTLPQCVLQGAGTTL